MDSMTTWWGTLQPLNQWFYVAAAFCSVFFLWQLIAAIAAKDYAKGERILRGHLTSVLNALLESFNGNSVV